jgi:hypothetical protein
MRRTISLLAILCFCSIAFHAKSQEVKINNNFVVEADGTVRMDADATTWNDLMIFPDATTRTGSNPPLYSKFLDNGSSSQGVFLNMFSASSEQELYFTVQIPHSYKIGTTLYPHVHWTTVSGTPSGSNVVWGLEYTVMQIGGNFPASTIIYASNVIPEIGTPSGTKQHLINEFAPMSASGIGISTILVCRLFRATGNSSDTFGNEVGLLGFDIHFQSDTFGSRTEFSK